MFTPNLIVEMGQNPRKYANILNSLKSTIHNKARGGSLKLRNFIKRSLNGITTRLTTADAKYLANESNYLWMKNYGKVSVMTALNTTQVVPSGSEPKRSVQTKQVAPKEVEVASTSAAVTVMPSGSNLMRDPNSTTSWINNTLIALKAVGGKAQKYITKDVIFNLLAAEVGAKSREINPRKANNVGKGYMGAYQLGVGEWSANRNHGIKGFRTGVVIGSTATGHSVTKSGASGGPADVLTAPAVWARYISKVVPGIPDFFLSKKPIEAVYLYHNLGSGNAQEIIAVGKVGSMSSRAAWAALTQLGYVPRGKGQKYVVSVSKARRQTSRTHRPLRAMMAGISSSGHVISENQFKEILINRVRNSGFASRLIA